MTENISRKFRDKLFSKSSGSCIHVGSIPTSGTIKEKRVGHLGQPFFSS